MSLMMRYQCKLSPELLSKAIKELNEPEENKERLLQIDSLREEFKRQYPQLKLVREDDLFILRFLRVKKFDQARALAAMKNYHYQRENWPELFEKVRNPVLVKYALEKGVICPLIGKAKNGSTVVVGRPGIENCTNVLDMFTCIYLTVEQLLEREETQVNGIVVINDLAYLNTEIAKQMTPLLVKKLIDTMQDCLPIRIKKMNLTNQPKIFDTIFAIIYPLLNEKFRKRLLLHGKDFSKLYEIVDRSVLPFMFAGSGPSLDPQSWKKEILSEGTEL